MRRIPAIVFLLALCFILLQQAEHAGASVQTDKSKAPGVAFIGAEDLKSRIASGERVSVVDVRSSESFANSDQKIRGAVHMKVRRIEHRLAFPPMKDVPRQSLVVTYCACPADESSIAAARVLLQNGFTNVRVLKGGWREWLKVSGQTEKKPRL